MNEVLILSDFYLPGFKAGGPIRTLSNLVDEFGDVFRFKILTRNHDFTETAPYNEVPTDDWVRIGKAEVYYTSVSVRTLHRLCRALKTTRYDILYLNSFFSPFMTIFPLLLRRLGIISPRKLVLAPRGELSAGALALKPIRKSLYISFANGLGLLDGIAWHASTTDEADEINKALPRVSRDSITVAPDNVRTDSAMGTSNPSPTKIPGQLRVIFLSRISRKKNLAYALRVLAQCQGTIDLCICGPQEDHKYWLECAALFRSLPTSISVTTLPGVKHIEVPNLLSQYHLLFVPTAGENFGHVFVEGLLAGCLVLTSDQTPWIDLEARGAGWALPLSEPSRFVDVIRKCVAAGPDEFAMKSAQAKTFIRAVLQEHQAICHKGLQTLFAC